MQSTPCCLSRRKGLRSSSGFLLTHGSSLFSGNRAFSLARPFSSLGDDSRLFPWSASSVVREVREASRRSFSVRDIDVRPAEFVASRACFCHSDLSIPGSSHSFICYLFRRTLMPAVGCSSGKAEVLSGGLDRLNFSYKHCAYSILSARGNVGFINKGMGSGRLVCGSSLKDQEPLGKILTGIGWSLGSSFNERIKGFHTATYSAEASSDVSLDEVRQEEQLDDAVSSDRKLGDGNLKLVSGSCYLPHPDKEDSGGEDAHFICDDEQAIGVADGVGGWADVGVNAGLYARELMLNSVNAVQEEPRGLVDPLRVLEKAYFSTKAMGSSTACIVALTEKGIHAVNLGDSGFIVIREGCTIFRSPVQQHDFNFTYQLESGNGSDLPNAAQIFTFPVSVGDVIVAGTDGLFDNLYNNEVAAAVVHATRTSLGPQAMARKIAELARQRAQDKSRKTPFSSAAREAGYLYHGGKLDDITVVVSFVSASSAS